MRRLLAALLMWGQPPSAVRSSRVKLDGFLVKARKLRLYPIPRDNARAATTLLLTDSDSNALRRSDEYTRMTHKAKDLSPDQKTAIESLLGRSIAEDEEISIRALASPPSAPEWLKASWKSAEEQGLDQLSMEEIDAEIAAARSARFDRRPSKQ